MISIRGMYSHEVDKVHIMLEQAFPNTPAQFFSQQVRADPIHKPEDTRLLIKNGEICSCVRVYFRSAYCEEKTILIGGIGDVGTLPKYQGRGYATKLMKSAFDYMKSKGAVISILFTRINPFYEQLGYFSIRTRTLQFTPPPLRQIISWRQVDLDRDLSLLMSFYRTHHEKRIGPIDRDAEYWRSQIAFPRLAPNLFWIYTKKGSPICYLRGRSDQNILKILEYGAHPNHYRSLWDLIAIMAQETGTNSIEINYLPNVEVELFQPLKPKIIDNLSVMVRLIQLNQIQTFQKWVKPYHILFFEADRF
jgi:predicted acetyltransferase